MILSARRAGTLLLSGLPARTGVFLEKRPNHFISNLAKDWIDDVEFPPVIVTVRVFFSLRGHVRDESVKGLPRINVIEGTSVGRLQMFY